MGIIVVLLLFISVVASLGGGGGGENSAKGWADQEHKKKYIGSLRVKNASGNSAYCGQRCTANSGQIAFRRYSDQDQTKGAIFTMDPDGSHVSQITHPPEGWSDDSPAWSPDGTKVAFYRGCSPSHCHGSRIMVVDVNTGNTRKVTHCIPDGGWTKEHPTPSSGHYCVGDSDPAFSPDGKSIAFRRIIGPEEASSIVEGIFIVGLDGSNPHQVTNVDPTLPESYSDSGPAFSPDGKRLVFDRTRLEDEHHAVFVQSIGSSGSPEDPHRITPWKMNCQDQPRINLSSPLTANWSSSFVCPRVRAAPPTSTGSTPTAQAWGS